MIDDLVVREGASIDRPFRSRQLYMLGITQSKAREQNQAGDMHSLPKSTARAIYWQDFVLTTRINLLALRSPRIAAEALDTGVNMGALWGVMMLQRALNALNQSGTDWPDLAKIDGGYMSLPPQHRTKLHSTNPLERLNGEIKYRTGVVGIFPNEDAVTRLVGALLLEQNDKWAFQQGRYMILERFSQMSDDPTDMLSSMAA